MSYTRADRKGPHRANYERNRKRILATQNTCGICGHQVDFSLKSPHPMSATIDHIIPVAKGGHPSDISNLQLAFVVSTVGSFSICSCIRHLYHSIKKDTSC